MPANIHTYIGRQAAWHKLGMVTGHYNSWAEILEAGGLDFDVMKSQLFDQLGNPVEAWGVFRYEPSSTDTIFLGTVGKDYTPIAHAQGFELVDVLMATTDGAHYETAGVLGKGEVVWGLADLGLTARIGDDVQQGYLLFSTSHDGSHSFTFRLCMTRVVCQNTLNVALKERSKSCFRVKHTRHSKNRLEHAHEALNTLTQEVSSLEEKLNYLARKKMTREATVTILDRLFPKTMKGEDTHSSTHREHLLSDVLALYEQNDGNAFPEQRGTAYNLLNAITNYADHHRTSHSGKPGQSAMFGSGNALKVNALDLIFHEAHVLPSVQQSIAVDFGELGLNVPELAFVNT